ncbi:L,D-transpeptidase family protein [Methylacidiphilum caldifontis]|nr:L,D-transpeptidase family protein [Methylacidiphilum caldifontis]
MRLNLLFVSVVLVVLSSGCALNNRQTRLVSSALPSNLIRVSIHDQKMELIQDVGKTTESHHFYPVSTSKYGIGDEWNSYKTPIGRFIIAKKIGDGIPLGGKFYHRKFTGDVIKLASYDPSKPAFNHDSILTRILWLKGLDAQNKNSFNRGIFIHGTNQEALVGQPVSYGCIRMKNKDVVQLYDLVSEYTPVYIQKEPLKKPIPKEVLASFHFNHSPVYSSTNQFSSPTLAFNEYSPKAIPLSTTSPVSFNSSQKTPTTNEQKETVIKKASLSHSPIKNSTKERVSTQMTKSATERAIHSSTESKTSLTKSSSHTKRNSRSHKTVSHSTSAKNITFNSSQIKKKKNLE